MPGSAANYKWVQPAVYPLFAALGAGCLLAVYAMGRNLLNNPDVHLGKQRRMAGPDGTHDDVSEQMGTRYRQGWLRQMGTGYGRPRIFNNDHKFDS